MNIKGKRSFDEDFVYYFLFLLLFAGHTIAGNG